MQLELFQRREFETEGFYLAPANEVLARRHSERIDEALGFRIRYTEEITEALDGEAAPHVQTWAGLDLWTLQTPYSDIVTVLKVLRLKPFQHVIDLGAAYGRIGIVIGGLYMKSFFTGYEFVRARVREGNRVYRELGLQRCELIEQDLAAEGFMVPDADVYFIYDYGHVEHIERTLGQLKLVAAKRPIRVVVAGKFTKQIIGAAHPWLNLQYEKNLSIYSAYLRL